MKIFTGKIMGNNLRREYDWNTNPVTSTEVKTSAVEFQTNEPFIGSSFVHYEIEGFYPIGSTVQIQMSIFEVEP